MEKYFHILGLNKGASKEDIQASYERLSKELNPADNDYQDFFIEEYNLVQEAYKAISGIDPESENPNISNESKITFRLRDCDSTVSIIKIYKNSTNKEKHEIISFLEANQNNNIYGQALGVIQKKTDSKNTEDSNTHTKNINPKRKSNSNAKKSKKYTLIAVVLIVLFFGGSYLYFLKKVSKFDDLIPKIEQSEVHKMEVEKSKWEFKFRKDYPMLKSYYKDMKNNLPGNLNFSDAIVSKDTTLSFLFFSDNFKFNSFESNYFKCAYNHEINRFENKNNKEFLAWYNKTRKRHRINRSKLDELIQIVKNNPSNSSFPYKTNSNTIDESCKKCISNYISKLELNEAATTDFDNFVVSYLKTEKLAKSHSAGSFINFLEDLGEFKQKMSNSMKKSFERKANKDKPNQITLWDSEGNSPKKYPYLYKSKSQYKFKDLKVLGEISYSLIKESYNRATLEKLVDDFNTQINESYKNNSLYTGAQPYSYCYGRNPSCSIPRNYAECSFIDVQASSGSDVIVVIKKSNKVFAHAYIKAGGYHKFKLGNGVFQTFFYYGKGWNPDKYIKTSDCGKVVGGFVSNESLDKSDKISLFHSSMSYTLYTVENGNFKPKPSNKNEAF